MEMNLENHVRRSSTETLPPRPGQHTKILAESFQPPMLKSPQQKTSHAMNTLQNFYGLNATNNSKRAAQGTEMAVYSSERSSSDPSKYRLLPKPSPVREKHRDLASGNFPPNDAGATPEKLLREESGGSGFSARTGKGLALRPKSGSRTALVADAESGFFSSVLVGLGDAARGLGGVRKSASTPSLLEQELPNVWPTSKWNLKPDLQALSSAAILDGLPKTISHLWNKAARD